MTKHGMELVKKSLKQVKGGMFNGMGSLESAAHSRFKNG